MLLTYYYSINIGMHEEASSCSTVGSACYSTEPSARRILDSHTQYLLDSSEWVTCWSAGFTVDHIIVLGEIVVKRKPSINPADCVPTLSSW